MLTEPLHTSVSADPLEAAREVLRRHWGYPDFRPGQDQAVRNVLGGGDSLTIMPTGGGKSLCYQVPAMMLPGLTVVVSPLISLMKDQVDSLAAAGLPATFLNSSLSPDEMQMRMLAAETGQVKLLYVAPERFDGERFVRRLAALDVSLLAIDEAHCVSEWGHDFRPSYLRLGEVRRQLGDPPIAALTATATEEVRRDIVRQLSLREAATLVTGFDRRNLVWHVLRAKNDSEKDRLLLKLLRGREGSAIVYASTRKNVDALTALLRGTGIDAVGYHAGLPDLERKRIQERFMSGAAPAVVATNAFGMGIDKRDVRIVVHYNMPGNLEAYYQEAGRAGRDGGPSDCVLLHAYADRFTHEFFIETANPPRRAVEAIFEALRRGADASGVCSIPVAELGRTVAGVKGDRMAASALRVLEQYGLVRPLGPAGSGVRVRLVARPERISRDLAGREAELGLLRTLWRRGGGEAAYRGLELEWGMLGVPGGRPEAARLLESLQQEGFLEWGQAGGDGVWVLDRTTPIQRIPVDWRGLDAKRERDLGKLQKVQQYGYTEECRRGFVLRYFGDPAAMRECGACDNCLRADGRPAVAGAGSADAVDLGGSSTQRGPTRSARRGDLLERLRDLRGELSRRHDLPKFMVFSEDVLKALSEHAPTTPEEVLRVPGVTPALLERWGAPLMELLGTFAGENGGRRSVARRSAREPAAPRRAAPEPAPPTAQEADLYGRLKTLRSKLAKEANLPSYCVFPAKTLIELARRRPANDAELLEVPGVGPAKLEKYGAAFLDALRED
jgi:ATP-dependent DNA helicase RecQ